MCQPGDQRGLFELFMLAHKENGFGGVEPTRVAEVIEKAVWNDAEAKYVIAVVLMDGRIVGAIGLQPARLWYGGEQDVFWSDLLFYVHPDHRRSTIAHRLMQFAQWWGQDTGFPVVFFLQPREDLGKKIKFFSRFGTMTGASFEIGA